MNENVLQRREELLCRVQHAINYLESRHISRAAIMVLATRGMIEYTMNDQYGYAPGLRPFPLGQTITYNGVEILPVYSVDQEDVMQPVVMYNGNLPKVPIGTVVCDTAHYDNGSMFDNLFVVAGSDERGVPTHFDKYDVRFDVPPLEDTKSYDNKAIMAFFAAAREKEVTTDAD